MRFDEAQYQGMVVINHHRNAGLRVAQTQLIGCPLKRVAGRYKNSTADALLALALISGLQAIPSKRVFAHEEKHGSKLRILVKCADPIFHIALNDKGRKSDLFISDQLWEKLTRQMNRFELSCEHIEQDTAVRLQVEQNQLVAYIA